MKRTEKLLVLGVLVMFLAVGLQATDSRKAVLTGTTYHEFTPIGMLITSVDALLNPIFMLDYSDFLNIDYDNATRTYSGFGFFKMKSLGLPGVLGVQIGKRYGSSRTGIWFDAGQDINSLNGLVAPLCGQDNVGVDGTDVTNLIGVRSYGIFYALPIGKELRAGFGFDYVGRGVSGKRINDPQSVSIFRDDIFKKRISDLMFRAGVGTVLREKIDLALDIGFGMPKYIYEYTAAAGSTADNEKASFSGSDLDLNLRVAIKMGDNASLVGNLSYYNFGGSLNIDPDLVTLADGTTYKRAQSIFRLLAGPLFHGESYDVGIQIGVMNESTTIETTIETPGTDTAKSNPTYFNIPMLRIMAEKQLAKWFTMRASVAYRTYTRKILTNTTTDPLTEDWEAVSTRATSVLTPAFGFTIDMKNGFIIDAFINDVIFLNAPYIVTGVNSGSLNAGVSIGLKL